MDGVCSPAVGSAGSSQDAAGPGPALQEHGGILYPASIFIPEFTVSTLGIGPPEGPPLLSNRKSEVCRSQKIGSLLTIGDEGTAGNLCVACCLQRARGRADCAPLSLDLVLGHLWRETPAGGQHFWVPGGEGPSCCWWPCSRAALALVLPSPLGVSTPSWTSATCLLPVFPSDLAASPLTSALQGVASALQARSGKARNHWPTFWRPGSACHQGVVPGLQAWPWPLRGGAECCSLNLTSVPGGQGPGREHRASG